MVSQSRKLLKSALIIILFSDHVICISEKKKEGPEPYVAAFVFLVRLKVCKIIISIVAHVGDYLYV